jgi:DNA-binding NtrC family response regulator
MTESAVGVAAGRVLVVDDDEGLARFVVEILTDAGHHAEAAPGAAAARRRVESGQYDVVVTDLRMPGESGLDLIAWLRRYDPRVAVLAVTAFGSLETAVQAMRLGAADYIPKPFEPSALLLAVDKSLRAHSMRAEIERLREEADDRYGFDAMVAESAVMRELVGVARRVADHRGAVLLQGPSGAGKELMARAIHQASRRRARPFVVIPCGAVPDAALDREVFGHWDASAGEPAVYRPGLLREADGGTVLVDEIADLPTALQVKLVRLMSEAEVWPAGGGRSVPVDVRVIAATQHDLRRSVAAGAFREDLFYRLSAVEMVIPPLTDRVDDILPLAERFLASAGARLGRRVGPFSKAAAQLLAGYAWPGNVRELEHAVERAATVAAGPEVAPEDFPPSLRQPRGHDFLDEAAARAMTISDLEMAYARRVLIKNGGNKKKTARLLGIDRRTLYRWLGEREEPAEPDEG